MIKTTQKNIKNYVTTGAAVDITSGDYETKKAIDKKESWLDVVAYASGVYGVNALLFKGHNTGALYAITCRSTALFIFH